MVKTIRLGSVYIGGLPFAEEVGCLRPKATLLVLGDTSPGAEIQWVQWGDKLVADRCVCMGINWSFLNKQGYVYGRPVIIDGKAYLCRCVKMTGVKSEWDKLLAEFGDSNDLWHCEKQWFWGQESNEIFPEQKTIRGYTSARNHGSCNADEESNWVGFRPMLEPLGPVLQLSDNLIGRQVKVRMTGSTCIFGQLAQFDEYDLFLKNTAGVGPDCAHAKKDCDNVILDRKDISWLEEVQK